MAYSKPSGAYPLTEGSTEGFTEGVSGQMAGIRHVRHGLGGFRRGNDQARATMTDCLGR